MGGAKPRLSQESAGLESGRDLRGESGASQGALPSDGPPVRRLA